MEDSKTLTADDEHEKRFIQLLNQGIDDIRDEIEKAKTHHILYMREVDQRLKLNQYQIDHFKQELQGFIKLIQIPAVQKRLNKAMRSYNKELLLKRRLKELNIKRKKKK